MITPIVVLTSLLVGFSVFSYWSNETKNVMHKESNAVLGHIDTAFKNHLQNNKKQVMIVAGVPQIKGVLDSKFGMQHVESIYYINTLFHKIKGQFPSMVNAYVFDKDMKLIYHFGPNANREEYWPRILINDLKSGEDIVSRFFHLDEMKISSYATSIKGKNREVIGYIATSENFDFLNGIVEKLSKLEHGYLFLANKNNVISNPEEFTFAKSISESTGYDSFYKKEHGISVINDDSFFTYVLPIKNGNAIFNAISTKPYQEELNIMMGAIFAICLAVAIFVSSVIIYFVNKYIVYPVKSLEQMSKSIANDDFDFNVSAQSQDEIGQLAMSFDEMKTSLNKSREEVEKLAYFDDLTGLGNRRTLNSFLESEIAHCEERDLSLSVMMLDLDDFKEVNDIYGHHIGDNLLQMISDRITETVIKSTIKYPKIKFDVSRIAGDEFTIVVSRMENIGISDIVASSVIEEFKKGFTIDGVKFNNSVSIGYSLFPRDSNNRASLLKYSDMAMYNAKGNGKNQCRIYTPDLMEKLNIKKKMKEKILSALDNNEFTLVYQPKVSSDTETVKQFEALIRWVHPVDGPISPSVFIPFAEENRLINAIGTWVIEQFCDDISKLESMGWSDFKISFNSSPKQLQDSDFRKKLKDCIKERNINPAHIEMEITEHSLARDFDTTIININKIKELGISVSLDDFGTGYSSLSYLEKLPIDTIKIDKSFVCQSNEYPARAAIIATIITLAKGLGMTAVAEGVETREEAEVVLSNGCDLLQGYYFYKPMPLEELEQFSKYCK